MEAAILAPVAKQVHAKLASMKDTKEETGATNLKATIKAFIVSAFEDDTEENPATKKTTNISSTAVETDVVIPPPTNNVTLASVLKLAKNCY